MAEVVLVPIELNFEMIWIELKWLLFLGTEGSRFHLLQQYHIQLSLSSTKRWLKQHHMILVPLKAENIELYSNSRFWKVIYNLSSLISNQIYYSQINITVAMDLWKKITLKKKHWFWEKIKDGHLTDRLKTWI